MSEAHTHPLKAWRDSRGLTQGALGAAVGLSASAISMIEKGHRGTSVEVALKLSTLSNRVVPLEALFIPKQKRRAA
jgi:DNA-binding XRE family transcriptional regulator